MSSILMEASPDVFRNDPRKLRGATMSVFGMLNWFYMWKSNATREGREEYADLVTNLTLKGLPGL